MWTLRHYDWMGIEHSWHLHDHSGPPARLLEAGGADAGPFLRKVFQFLRACHALPTFHYSMVDEMLDAAEQLEDAVREMKTAPVLAFAVVMAIEDFMKKVMLAKDDLMRCEVARKKQERHTALAFRGSQPNLNESTETIRVSAEEFHARDLELAQASEYASSAALAVVLACEAAWNGHRSGAIWGPAELDLPEE